MPNTRRVRAGEIIIREGDEGSEGYLIVSGAVEVHKAAPGGDLPLAVLGKND
ncbi:MAG: cyclic nucleotide-binding domain-containing protein, partial [Chloroflexi bacterium]|nr:cyclic nucleotide-binding domain-containing protein [Chloroflexota bacterium]